MLFVIYWPRDIKIKKLQWGTEKIMIKLICSDLIFWAFLTSWFFGMHEVSIKSNYYVYVCIISIRIKQMNLKKNLESPIYP